jgi:hypothetical protein
MPQIVQPIAGGASSPILPSAAGQLLPEPPREPLRMLMAALQVTEHQRVIAGQPKVKTSAGQPPTPQRSDRLRIEINNSLPAGLGGAFDDLGAFAFRPY